MKISYSRASSYLACPQKHYFSYVEGLKPRGKVRPLSFGSDFHKLLENRSDRLLLESAWIGIRDTYYDLPAQQQSELGEDYLTDLETIFVEYITIWKDTEKPIATEHEFCIQIGTYMGEGLFFNGIIDEIYEDALGEHKTFNQMPDLGTLAMNMQVCLYAKAWEIETGGKLNRVKWDYIKSRPASQPVWLEKSKRFSEAASNSITHLSWLRACAERGIIAPEILEKALNYEKNISNFFFRTETELVPNMVDSVWEDFKQVCRDIVLWGETNKVKNITRNCSFCNYRSICYAEFTGVDTEYVKQTDFVVEQR